MTSRPCRGSMVLVAAMGACAGVPEPGAGPAEATQTEAAQSELSTALSSPLSCSWTQWGQSADHAGSSCVRGQTPERVLDHIVYDPFEFQEIAEGFGGLFMHYQVPLTAAVGGFYMMHKAGTYTSCDPPGSGEPFPCGFAQENIVQEIWQEKRYQRLPSGKYVESWTFESDWKPFPLFRWEPMFQPALWGPIVYIPGAGGSGG